MTKKTLIATLAMMTMIFSARADIVSTSGLTIIAAPPVVDFNYLVNLGLPPQVIFAEQKGVLLTTNLNTDTGVILAGTLVDSYFVSFDVDGRGFAGVHASATFDRPVLGMIWRDGPDPYGSPNPALDNPFFAASDFLGATGTTYLESLYKFFAFENTPAPEGDLASIVGNVANFLVEYNKPGDSARIVTAAAVPGPIAGAGLPGIIAACSGLLFLARRRRARQLA